MTMHILDTDIFTLFLKGQSQVVSRVASMSSNELAITILTVEEQISGWYRQLRVQKQPAELARIYSRMTQTIRSISRLSIISFSESAIHRSQQLAALRLNVRKMDLCIAAIALEIGAKVVTRNLRDFRRIPGLDCEDWSA